jgi:hypothetical protein
MRNKTVLSPVSKPIILNFLRSFKSLKKGSRAAYLTESVFFTSFKGARRPLARGPGYLKDDTNAANLSIDFSAIPLYVFTWETLHPNFLSVLIFVSSRSSVS